MIIILPDAISYDQAAKLLFCHWLVTQNHWKYNVQSTLKLAYTSKLCIKALAELNPLWQNFLDPRMLTSLLILNEFIIV